MDRTTVDRIRTNFETFQSLLDTAESYFQQGKLDAAATFAQMAAKFASGQHPGMFASRRLEQLLQRTGQAMFRTEPALRAPATASDAFPRNVLHVLTGVSGIGGHTRMLWRWIGWDSERCHSVAVTNQGSGQLPAQLLESVNRSDGRVHLLDSGRGGHSTRAGRLRRLVNQVDLVVLHTDPDDVTASLALAGERDRPRVAYLNHADQFFWTGAGVTDTLINLRSTGADLSRRRRGIGEDRFALLPIPVPPIAATLAKREARKRIGVPDDAIVMLSIARPHKFAQVDGVSYLDAVLPVVEAHEHVRLIAVGAGDDEAWQAARRKVGERARPEGIRGDTLPYYLAADIYIDSYPVASITSLLEAGSLGLPLVSRYPDGSGDSVFSADTPALERVVLGATSPSGFREILDRLILNEGERQCAGERARCGIQDVHGQEGWSRALDRTYRAIASTPAGSDFDIPPDEPAFELEDRLLPVLFPREPDLELVMKYNARHLPLVPRLRLLKQLHGRGHHVNPGLALSHYRASQLERARRAIDMRRSHTRRRFGT